MHFSTPTPSTLSDVFLKYLAKTKTTTQRFGRISPNINQKIHHHGKQNTRRKQKNLGGFVPDPKVPCLKTKGFTGSTGST